MAKEQALNGRKKTRVRKPRRKDLAETRLADGERVLTSLQHTIGNRAVQRVLERGHLQGQAHSRIFSPERLRQIARKQAEARVGAVPAIQREEAEALDAAPAAVNDGLVTINEPQSETYEVRGATLAAVSAALDPVEWGRCRWTVDYSFETAGGRATKVDITLHLTIRMPRWAGEGFQQASVAAREEWQRMLGALQAHEDHHAGIARDWAPTFKERMLNKRQSRLARTHQQVLGEMEKEQKKYDKDSHHGQTEGVSLDTSIQ